MIIKMKNWSSYQSYKDRKPRRIPIPFFVRKSIYENSQGKCTYCKCQTSLFREKNFMIPIGCIDHIIPIKYGGTSKLDNLQLLCIYCNAKKFDSLDFHKKMMEAV